jgi:hypothetical protein
MDFNALILAESYQHRQPERSVPVKQLASQAAKAI